MRDVQNETLHLKSFNMFAGCAIFKMRLNISGVSRYSPDARFPNSYSASQEFQDIRAIFKMRLGISGLSRCLVRELEKDQEPFAVCAELFVSITNNYLTVASPLVVKVGLDAF